MSERPSTCFAERTCSGDMYIGDPITVLSCVIARRGALLSATSMVAVTFEMPKSRTFTSAVPSRRSVTNRFSGLRSR